MVTFSRAPAGGEATIHSAAPAASDVSNMDVNILMGADGTIEDVSPAAGPALGYPSDHLVGSLLFRYVNQQELVSFLRHVGAVALGGEEEAQLEVRLRGADGFWRAFQAKIQARLNGQAAVGVILTLHPLLTALME